MGFLPWGFERGGPSVPTRAVSEAFVPGTDEGRLSAPLAVPPDVSWGYLVNLNSAVFDVPSLSFTVSIRHVFAHAVWVFHV